MPCSCSCALPKRSALAPASTAKKRCCAALFGAADCALSRRLPKRPSACLRGGCGPAAPTAWSVESSARIAPRGGAHTAARAHPNWCPCQLPAMAPCSRPCECGFIRSLATAARHGYDSPSVPILYIKTPPLRWPFYILVLVMWTRSRVPGSRRIAKRCDNPSQRPAGLSASED